MPRLQYLSRSGIGVTRTASKVPFKRGLRGLLRELDTRRGAYLSSGYEFPGRYSRWDIATVRPPLEIVAYGRRVEIRALNERGRILNRILQPVLEPHPHWESLELTGAGALAGRLKPLPRVLLRRGAQQAAVRVSPSCAP